MKEAKLHLSTFATSYIQDIEMFVNINIKVLKDKQSYESPKNNKILF